jgi:hypothetical protein
VFSCVPLRASVHQICTREGVNEERGCALLGAQPRQFQIDPLLGLWSGHFVQPSGVGAPLRGPLPLSPSYAFSVSVGRLRGTSIRNAFSPFS